MVSSAISRRNPDLFNLPASSGELRLDFPSRIYLSSEERRLQLLHKIKSGGAKVNILNDQLSKNELDELLDLTRKKYCSMPCMKTALRRLYLAFDETFPREESSKLKLLTNHVIGYYLNTHQYHNAFHALYKILETLNICKILGVKDLKALKTLVVIDLYHDTGNGEAPVAPDNEYGDEVQSARIYNNDQRTVRARLASGEPLGALAALAEFETETMRYPLAAKSKPPANTPGTSITGECTLAEAVNAGIAFTVFRDRFEDSERYAFDNKYVQIILKDFYQTDQLKATQLQHFLELSKSYFVWIAKNSDISGSLERLHAILYCLKCYDEDQKRLGFKPGENKDFVQYHSDFFGFLRGIFAPADSTMAKIAKEHCICPFPALAQQDHATFYSTEGMQRLEKFIIERVNQEERQFGRAKDGFGGILTALFIIAAQESRAGKSISTLCIKELRQRLAEWREADLARIKEVLPETAIESWSPGFEKLEYNLDDFPLLHLEEFQEQTIADLSPAMFNRIFLHNIAEVRTLAEAEQIDRLENLARISRKVRPADRDLKYLKEHFGELSRTQKNLILYYAKINIEPDCNKNALQRILCQAWTKLRQEFHYHEIILLAEAGIIDSRIAGSSEEASRIQHSVLDIERKRVDTEPNPCLTSISNLLEHCPRSFRMLALKSEAELIKLGENTGAVYILLKGDLTVDINGRKIALKPGEPVGEMSVLTGLGASAAVYVPKGKSAIVAMVLEEDILNQFAAEDLYADLVNLARVRRGISVSYQNEPIFLK